MDEKDRVLVERFRDGDPAAFEAIVERWDAAVLNLAYRLCGDREEARDIRQLAFVKAYRARSGFNGEASLSTWIYRIVVNLCRDRHRSRKARDSALRASLASGSRAPAAPSPVADSIREENARIVAEAIASLPPREREVVILRHYHGKTFTEVATIVGSPVSTVKSRVDRGLRGLRATLQHRLGGQTGGT